MKQQKGFTLIELLVVIAIIGILSSVVLASLNSARLKGRDAIRVSDMGQVKLALELYFDSNRTYPVEAAGTLASTSVAGAALVTSGFMQAIPIDPTAAGIYMYSGTATTYVLRAQLEDTQNTVLDGDVDDADALGIDCQDTTSPFYCVRP